MHAEQQGYQPAEHPHALLTPAKAHQHILYCPAGCNSATKQCITCVCSTGDCCDGCNYRPSTYVCGYSDYNSWVPTNHCFKKRDVYKCSGTSANCDTVDDGDAYGVAPAYRVITSSGGESDATSASLACDGNTNYYCAAGGCSGYYRYSECDGGTTCDTGTATYYQQYNVNADSGYTLTSTCGKQGTTPCGTSNCPADSCTGVTTYNDYPATCGKKCNGQGTCVACTCSASATGSCSASNDCSTTPTCGGNTIECHRTNDNKWHWDLSTPSIGTETACSDGYDNDCDGNIDSADGDCCIPHGSSRTCSSDSDCCGGGTTNYCSKNNPDGTQMSSSQWHCCTKGDEYWDPYEGASGSCVGTTGACGVSCSYDITSNPQQYFNPSNNCVVPSSQPYRQSCCSVDLYGQTDKRYMDVTVY